MRFLETTQLTENDWLVDFYMENGERIRKGVSPKRTEEEARYLALQFIPIGARQFIREVDAQRRKDRTRMQREVEARLNAQSNRTPDG